MLYHFVKLLKIVFLCHKGQFWKEEVTRLLFLYYSVLIWKCNNHKKPKLRTGKNEPFSFTIFKIVKSFNDFKWYLKPFKEFHFCFCRWWLWACQPINQSTCQCIYIKKYQYKVVFSKRKEKKWISELHEFTQPDTAYGRFFFL